MLRWSNSCKGVLCLALSYALLLMCWTCNPNLLLRDKAVVQSTYTGVYKKGGPSCVDPGRQLSDLVDRSTGEARRRKKAAPEVSPLQTAACNSAGGTRRPAPVITTLLPVPSGR